MAKIRRRRDERQHVGIITDEWVENNCTNVTERDIAMLHLLNRFPLLSSQQLMLLTPGAGRYKPFYTLSQSQKRCNERIRMLYDLHCVNKWSPKLAIGEGTSKQYVALDRAGCKLLNIERRIRRDLPQDWRHRSLIMDIYTALIVGERQQQWSIEYLEVEEKQGTFPIIPDLTAIIRCGHRGLALFIEVDRSEKKESVEKQKLAYYRDWQLSKVWISEPWCQSMPRPLFPIVLYVFDETKQGWKRRRTTLAKEASALHLSSEWIGFSEYITFLKTQLKP